MRRNQMSVPVQLFHWQEGCYNSGQRGFLVVVLPSYWTLFDWEITVLGQFRVYLAVSGVQGGSEPSLWHLGTSFI